MTQSAGSRGSFRQWDSTCESLIRCGLGPRIGVTLLAQVLVPTGPSADCPLDFGGWRGGRAEVDPDLVLRLRDDGDEANSSLVPLPSQ